MNEVNISEASDAIRSMPRNFVQKWKTKEINTFKFLIRHIYPAGIARKFRVAYCPVYLRLQGSSKMYLLAFGSVETEEQPNEEKRSIEALRYTSRSSSEFGVTLTSKK
jgi:hypothetical protein